MTLEEMRAYLRGRVNPRRYLHSIGVAESAQALAKLHGADPDRAYLAGLLHDCSKYMSGEDMLAFAMGRGLPVDEAERLTPGLLHGKVSRSLAQRDYGVEDEEVLTAIERHITGAPGMSMLDLLVNLADYVEPGRDFPQAEAIRALAQSDPERAMAEAFRGTMLFVLSRGLPLHPGAVITYNSLLAKLPEQRIPND